MYFLLPPSSAFNFITAWAVVAEPEKKSKVRELSFTYDSSSLINSVGFGVSKTFDSSSSFNSCVASVFSTEVIKFL